MPIGPTGRMLYADLMPLRVITSIRYLIDTSVRPFGNAINDPSCPLGVFIIDTFIRTVTGLENPSPAARQAIHDLQHFLTTRRAHEPIVPAVSPNTPEMLRTSAL